MKKETLEKEEARILLAIDIRLFWKVVAEIALAVVWGTVLGYVLFLLFNR